MKPLSDWLFLEVEKAPQKSAGGIHLPDSANAAAKVRYATVVAAGPGRWANAVADTVMVRQPLAVSVGNRVMLLPNVGYDVEIEGRKLLAVPESAILAVV